MHPGRSSGGGVVEYCCRLDFEIPMQGVSEVWNCDFDAAIRYSSSVFCSDVNWNQTCCSRYLFFHDIMTFFTILDRLGFPSAKLQSVHCQLADRRQRRCRRNGRRAILETLEDRCVLATYMVTSLADTGVAIRSRA